MAKSIWIGIALCGALLLPAASVRAQNGAGNPGESSSVQNAPAGDDPDIVLLRKDLRSKKKQMVTDSLKLSEADTKRFWPVYDSYTADLVRINNEKYEVIKEYRNSFGSITDEQAVDLTRRALEADEKVSALRMRYVSRFLEVLPGRKLATFFQIERRLQEMINLQLMSEIPLVQDQH
ncbi:MAG TPA: hypothetical protein VGD60_13050 [Candidatus Acidoferrales bacterium]